MSSWEPLSLWYCFDHARLRRGLKPVPGLPPGRQAAVLKLGTGGHRQVRLGLAGGEVLGIGGAGELFAHQAGQAQQRAAWPVVRHDVLGLPGGVAGDQDDTADWLAAQLCRVVLEEAVGADGADEVERLM